MPNAASGHWGNTRARGTGLQNEAMTAGVGPNRQYLPLWQRERPWVGHNKLKDERQANTPTLHTACTARAARAARAARRIGTDRPTASLFARHLGPVRFSDFGGPISQECT